MSERLKDEAQGKYFTKYIELNKNKSAAYQNLWIQLNNCYEGNL